MTTEKIRFQIGVDVLGFPIYHYHELTFKVEDVQKPIFKSTDGKLPSKFIINRLYNNKKPK